MDALLASHLEISPDVRRGKLCLAGTRISVDDIVVLHLHLGFPLDEIATTYVLSMSAVHSAMAYYYDHQAGVDQAIEADLAFAEAFESRNVSPMKEKLKGLAR